MTQAKKANKYSVLSLPDIIKRKTKRRVSFLELEHDERRGVLDYIENNKIDIRVFGYKWYDILSKKFFAIEYKPREETTFGIDETELSFDSFEDLACPLHVDCQILIFLFFFLSASLSIFF